ncbi:hypothetical protein J2Z21_009431 [Streptomyces griseochromogenes]|uniref:Uncharacterized protein n=1 Tax=Streptomyces griseochromogenes TaxID=68214 RepID=A0ABS4M9U2_9ACTN|nr:hypothetical protein [Streptomyces griseochromogenes]MBP2056413.1 hypothetical protein [Streptomyces griseochromogenes]
MVEGLLRYSDAEVLARLRRRRQRRDPLGFGFSEVAPLVTPVLWLALDGARKRVADAVVDSAAHGSASLWQRILRRRSKPEVIPVLTRAQQALVKEMVLDAAVEAGLSQQRAKRIADGVVAGLALAEPGEVRDESDAGEAR